MEKMSKKREGHDENEMHFLLLDEKICFIRLPPDTLQNF